MVSWHKIRGVRFTLVSHMFGLCGIIQFHLCFEKMC